MHKLVLISLITAVGMLWLTTGCDTSVESSSKHQIAMLAEGVTFDDMGFLQNCKTGLEAAKADFNLECAYDVDTCTTRYEERLRYFAEQNFDLLISVGYMWDSAVIAVSQDFPDIAFVLVDAELSEPQPNVVSVLFDVDEAAYPLGYLSAWWASHQDPDDPVVGFVGGMYINQIRQFTEPYTHGVELYNQTSGESVSYCGEYALSFVNPDVGAQIADSLIVNGADVILGVGGLTGSGALQKAQEYGTQAIGVDVDQYISFPEVSDILLSSAMKGLDHAIYAVVASFVEGDFSNGIYTGNLANLGVALAPYHDYETLIPDSVKTEIEAIKSGIIEGSISTGWQ